MSLSIAQREVKKLVEQRHFVRVSLFLSFSVAIERSSGRRKEGRKEERGTRCHSGISRPLFTIRVFWRIACACQIFEAAGQNSAISGSERSRRRRKETRPGNGEEEEPPSKINRSGMDPSGNKLP